MDIMSKMNTVCTSVFILMSQILRRNWGRTHGKLVERTSCWNISAQRVHTHKFSFWCYKIPRGNWWYSELMTWTSFQSINAQRVHARTSSFWCYKFRVRTEDGLVFQHMKSIEKMHAQNLLSAEEVNLLVFIIGPRSSKKKITHEGLSSHMMKHQHHSRNPRILVELVRSA